MDFFPPRQGPRVTFYKDDDFEEELCTGELCCPENNAICDLQYDLSEPVMTCHENRIKSYIIYYPHGELSMWLYDKPNGDTYYSHASLHAYYEPMEIKVRLKDDSLRNITQWGKGYRTAKFPRHGSDFWYPIAGEVSRIHFKFPNLRHH